MSGVNFTPDEDESRFQISVRLPVGSSLAATQSLLDRIARDVRAELPGVLATRWQSPGSAGGGQGGNNGGNMFVRLKPIHERDALAAGADAPGAAAGPAVPQERRDLGPGHRRAVVRRRPRRADSVRARRSRSRRSSTSTRRRRVEAIDKSPALVDVDRSYLPGLPELRLDIDRKRAADLGVRVQDVSQTVNALIAGPGRDDVQRGERSVRSRAQGAGLVPADAGLDRRGDGPHGVGRAGAAAQPRHVQRGLRAGVDRSSQPPAADHDLRQPGARHLAGRRPGRARGGVRVARHGAGLHPRHQRPVARARARGVLLRHRVRAVVRLHVHGAGGAVRIVHPSGDDPADAAAGGAVRPRRVAALRPAAEHLFRARRPAALRHREEERDPADRSHDRTARQGDAALRTRSSRPTAIGCGRS